MKYALFLGCTIPVRSQNYEMAARQVAEKIGLDLIDMPEFSCCGFPTKSADWETTMVIAARNLALAADQHLDICTLCNACTGVLTEINKELSENDELRNTVNKRLKKVGYEFTPGVNIRHFDRILYQEYGPQKLKKYVQKDLSMLSIAVHYGCHYNKPKEIYDCFEDPENPRSFDELIEVTGATSIEYKDKLDCCGGAILGVQEDIALHMAKNKLDNVTREGVDALVTQCPFCSIMYEDNRRKIEAAFNNDYQGLPVLYYPQVLGLSYGIDPKALGFRLNKIKPHSLLEKIG
jgi:heterodisulfide reductase subunit B